MGVGVILCLHLIVQVTAATTLRVSILPNTEGKTGLSVQFSVGGVQAADYRPQFEGARDAYFCEKAVHWQFDSLSSTLVTRPALDARALFYCTRHSLTAPAEMDRLALDGVGLLTFQGTLDAHHFEIELNGGAGGTIPASRQYMLACSAPTMPAKIEFRNAHFSGSRFSATVVKPAAATDEDEQLRRCNVIVNGDTSTETTVARTSAATTYEVSAGSVSIPEVSSLVLRCEYVTVAQCVLTPLHISLDTHIDVKTRKLPQAVGLAIPSFNRADSKQKNQRKEHGASSQSTYASTAAATSTTTTSPSTTRKCFPLVTPDRPGIPVALKDIELCMNSSSLNRRECLDLYTASQSFNTCPVTMDARQVCVACWEKRVKTLLQEHPLVITRRSWRHNSNSNSKQPPNSETVYHAVDFTLEVDYTAQFSTAAGGTTVKRVDVDINVSDTVPAGMRSVTMLEQMNDARHGRRAVARSDDEDTGDEEIVVDGEGVPIGVSIAIIVIIAAAAALVVIALLAWPARVYPAGGQVVHVARA